jgi:O-antigen ligase
VIIAFLLPVNKKWVPPFIGLLMLYSIVYAVKNKYWHFSKMNAVMLIPLFLYLALLATFPMAIHEEAAASELEYKLSMILFPLLTWMIPSFDRDQMRKMVDAFVMGCVVFLLFSAGYGIYRVNTLGSAEYFTYSNLGLIYHPTYMALYQSITLSILLLRGMRSMFFLGSKWVHWILTISVMFYIVLLASKAGFITAVLSIAWAGIEARRRGVLIQHLATVCLAAMFVFVGLILATPAAFSRIEETTKEITTQAAPTHEAWSSTELRKVTWRSSIELMNDSWFGSGVGETTERLIGIYLAHGETYAAEKRLNAHNQYLQVGAEYGWGGFFLFIIFIGIVLIQMWKSERFLFIGIGFFTAMNLLFESMFEVQAGVVFFYFFLLLFYNTEETKVL